MDKEIMNIKDKLIEAMMLIENIEDEDVAVQFDSEYATLEDMVTDIELYLEAGQQIRW